MHGSVTAIVLAHICLSERSSTSGMVLQCLYLEGKILQLILHQPAAIESKILSN
jgi:hypothetical protein